MALKIVSRLIEDHVDAVIDRWQDRLVMTRSIGDMESWQSRLPGLDRRSVVLALASALTESQRLRGPYPHSSAITAAFRFGRACHDLKVTIADLMAEYAALRQEVIATVGIVADGRADILSEVLAQINHCLDQMLSASVESFQTCALSEVSKPAVLDSLTSLYHHGYFWDRVIDEVSRAVRYERPLSVVVLDVDRFKEVNDTHGHLGGDSILRGLATVLKSRRRRSDVVARYGGDEFAMILPETPIAGAGVLAERMRRAVEKRKFETDRGVLLTITFSAGCAALESGMSARDLVRQADRALYHAKRAGANQVSIIADVAALGV